MLLLNCIHSVGPVTEKGKKNTSIDGNVITLYMVKHIDGANRSEVAEGFPKDKRSMQATTLFAGYSHKRSMVDMNNKVGISPFLDLVTRENGVTKVTKMGTFTLSLG